MKFCPFLNIAKGFVEIAIEVSYFVASFQIVQQRNVTGKVGKGLSTVSGSNSRLEIR